eukprot:CAMPEP_0184021568 /NCGR_PEP_ID=MMETSP0954-20121128/10013_1 /TAXON_ID=627963 /ORGANISM="Aplanochytrium sp, Strain PBS07" /LENGTH=247 /DNA_ID=CAMNT_0026303627 /DNA_START=463 /DNA_END=1206 /DNA_ORIENTATION=-
MPHGTENDAAEAARALFYLHTSPITAPIKSQMGSIPEMSLSSPQMKQEGSTMPINIRGRNMLGSNNFNLGRNLNSFGKSTNGSTILSSSAPAAGAAGTLCSLMAIAEAGKHMQNNGNMNVFMHDASPQFSSTEKNRARTLSLMSLDTVDGDHGSNGLRNRSDSTYSIQSEPGFQNENGGNKMIGAYTPASRRKLLDRFLEKRRNRIWKKRIKYGVRKNFADSRLRVKGRFVRKEDEEQLREFLLMTL